MGLVKSSPLFGLASITELCLFGGVNLGPSTTSPVSRGDGKLVAPAGENVGPGLGMGEACTLSLNISLQFSMKASISLACQMNRRPVSVTLGHGYQNKVHGYFLQCITVYQRS